MSLVVMYKGANQHSVSAGPKDRIVLNPGNNTVDRDVWGRIVKAAEKNDEKGGVKHLEDVGLIKIIDSNDSSKIDINTLNQPEALELVEAETVIDNLINFGKQNEDGKKRPKVGEAIELRVMMIEEAEEKERASHTG